MKRVTPLFAVVALGLGGGTASAEQAPAPRTLPSGAPACGNAQSKSPRPCTTIVAKIEPLTLRSGAPACGNVLDKVNGNKRDPSYVSCVRDEPAGIALRNKMVVAKVFKLLGLSAASLKIAPARPRELRTGAPAPGNVARRTSPSDERREQRPIEPAAREIHHD